MVRNEFLQLLACRTFADHPELGEEVSRQPDVWCTEHAIHMNLNFRESLESLPKSLDTS